MKPSDMNLLAEAKIREALQRGDLSNLPGAGQPLPPDPLEGLTGEERTTALIHRSLGAAPEEVELMREVAALRERLAAAPEAERPALQKLLAQRSLRLSLLHEAAGRHLLAGQRILP